MASSNASSTENRNRRRVEQKKSVDANTVIRDLLGVIYFVSSAAEVINPAAAANFTSPYLDVSNAFALSLVYALSALELLLGVLLVLDKFAAPAAFCSTLLMLSAIFVGFHFAGQPKHNPSDLFNICSVGMHLPACEGETT